MLHSWKRPDAFNHSELTAIKPSFTRGVLAGAVHDDLLFPYPPSLDQRNAAEAAVVRRLRFRANRVTLGLFAEVTDAKRRTVAADVREAGAYFVKDSILEVSPDQHSS